MERLRVQEEYQTDVEEQGDDWSEVSSWIIIGLIADLQLRELSASPHPQSGKVNVTWQSAGVKNKIKILTISPNLTWAYPLIKV